MLGGLFFVPMVGLLGMLIAWYRRDPRRFLDGPTEDAPLRLMRWAIGLLAPRRAEWGQAMLGELGHIEGRIRRMRFALGCVGAALVLPPWGWVATGVWAMIVLAGRCRRPVRRNGGPLRSRRRRLDRGVDPYFLLSRVPALGQCS